jgi:hypothetical protein
MTLSFSLEMKTAPLAAHAGSANAEAIATAPARMELLKGPLPHLDGEYA